MAKNLSVEQFKELMSKLPPAVAAEMREELVNQAQILARSQSFSARIGETGNLRKSIRVEEGRHPLQVFVKAGGPLTTRPVRQGQSATYDYSLGVEFGNSKVPAQPFFWTSYRAGKKKIRAAIGRRVKPAMAKLVNVK